MRGNSGKLHPSFVFFSCGSSARKSLFFLCESILSVVTEAFLDSSQQILRTFKPSNMWGSGYPCWTLKGDTNAFLTLAFDNLATQLTLVRIPTLPFTLPPTHPHAPYHTAQYHTTHRSTFSPHHTTRVKTTYFSRAHPHNSSRISDTNSQVMFAGFMGYSKEFVFEYMMPGVGISLVSGNLYYALQVNCA